MRTINSVTNKPAKKRVIREGSYRKRRMADIQAKYKIVLIRHGESEWNLKNVFTGWEDVCLSVAGHKEAEEGGRRLKEAGFTFDIVFTSVL